MFTAMEEEDRQIIEEFFEVTPYWSLIGFLQYREGTDSFTYDKRREHKLYVKVLDALPKNDVRVQECLADFEVEYIITINDGGFKS